MQHDHTRLTESRIACEINCVIAAKEILNASSSPIHFSHAKSKFKPCQVSWLGKIMLSSAIRGAQLVGLGVCSFGGNSFKFQLFFTSRDNLPLDIVSHQPEVVLVVRLLCCVPEKLNSNRSCSAVEVFSIAGMPQSDKSQLTRLD